MPDCRRRAVLFLLWKGATMLLGSNVQPSIIDMSGTPVQLGEVVRFAVRRGGYTTEQWNALGNDEREIKIASARKWMECAFAEPGGLMAVNPEFIETSAKQN